MEMPVDGKIPVGILGATGTVGQRMVQLPERHPWFEVAWLGASERSVGQTYAEAARWKLKTAIPAAVAGMKVSDPYPENAPKVVFAALDAAVAQELEPQDRKSTRLNSSHIQKSRMPSSA